MTVPAKGYRFVAKVKTAAAHDALVGVPSTPEGPAPIVVGREAELARLQSWSEQVLEGRRRRVVFIAGERASVRRPSCGPSRFSARVRHESGAGSVSSNTARASQYMPVLEVLMRFCQEPHRQRVVELLHKFAPTWLAQMPSLLSPADCERLQATAQSVSQPRDAARDRAGAGGPRSGNAAGARARRSTLERFFNTQLISVLARRTEPRLLILGRIGQPRCS